MNQIVTYNKRKISNKILFHNNNFFEEIEIVIYNFKEWNYNDIF